MEGLRQYEIWPWPAVLRRHGTRTIGGATAAWERCRRDVGRAFRPAEHLGAFPQNTVDLIKTFAAASVLAVLNARLFKNVEARTGELVKSLQDLRTAQDPLVQTEKLASLGQLTAGSRTKSKTLSTS